MLHDQNDQGSWTSHKRALFIAPLSAFPIVLVFGILRDCSINDFRSIQAFLGLALFPAFEALIFMMAYYPFQVAIFGIALMCAPKLILASLGRTVLIGLVSAEVLLLIDLYPEWQLDNRTISYSVVLAACGVATGLIFHRLSHRYPPI